MRIGKIETKEQHLSNVSDKLCLGKRLAALWTRISFSVLAVPGKGNQEEEEVKGE